jgi:alkylation response protein AidB-like acyl-CoA dehydrogenase
MNFDFDAEQELLRNAARRVADERLAPLAAEVDELNEVSPEVVRILKEAGLFELVVPEEYGGTGIKAVSICIVREELARRCSHADSVFAIQGIGAYPIATAGNEDQKRRYLPPFSRGEKLAAFALTEPDAGSDVAAIKATATEDGNDYAINGTKTLITNAGDAHVYIVFAKTDPSPGHRGISAFIVESTAPGFKATRRLELLSPHPIGDLEFNDCRVPRENLLGQPGDGFRIAMKNLDVYRTSVGASAVGMARFALETALSYAKDRTAFGRPLAEMQAIQIKLADIATELDAARLLVYRAASMKDSGVEDLTKVASMAKLFATEAAGRAADQALQIHGGVGLVKQSPVARLYRAARASRIYEGTSEIQRMVIARQLLREGPD